MSELKPLFLPASSEATYCLASLGKGAASLLSKRFGFGAGGGVLNSIESDEEGEVVGGDAGDVGGGVGDKRYSRAKVKDYEGVPHVYRRSKKTSLRRRRAFIELSRDMHLLRNFTMLNYTAVMKIAKKYRKNLGQPVVGLDSFLAQKRFVQEHELDQVMNRVTRAFANEFCEGNLRVAEQALLEKQGVDVDWAQYKVGIQLGLVISLFLWFVWDAVVDEYLRPVTKPVWEYPLFRVYRGIGSFILLQWCWAVLVYTWKRARVNYIYLFDLDVELTSTPAEMFEHVSSVTIFFLINLILWFKVNHGDFPDWIPAPFWPLIMFVVYILSLLYPWRKQRALFGVIGSVAVAPFGAVTFYSTFIGDFFTSMVKPAQDLAFGFCTFTSLHFLSDDMDEREYCDDHTILKPFFFPLLAALPMWLRLMQCLRQYYNTHARFPSLANAFKYAFAHSVIVFAALNPRLLDFENETERFNSVIFIAVFAISTLYTFTWDITMDWSLMRPSHALLRADRMYSYSSLYYVAIVADFFMRFLWTTSLLPLDKLPNTFGRTAIVLLKTFLGPIEILRRSMWAVFRVENEHLHSTEGFRKQDFVPLYFETPVGSDRKKDRVTGWVLFLEVSAFILVVGAAAALAIIFR